MYMSKTRVRDLIFLYINLLILFALLCINIAELQNIKDGSVLIGNSTDLYVYWGIRFASIIIATAIVAVGLYRTSRNLVDINKNLIYGEMCLFAFSFVARDFYQMITYRNNGGTISGTNIYNLVVSLIVVLVVCLMPLIGKNLFQRFGHVVSFITTTLLISISINNVIGGSSLITILFYSFMVPIFILIFVHMLIKTYDFE